MAFKPKKARILSSFTSTKIEGNPLSLTAVKTILKTEPKNIKDTEKEVINYNKDVSKYFRKVGVFGDYYDIANDLDFTEWLEYFVEGILDELNRVKKD